MSMHKTKKTSQLLLLGFLLSSLVLSCRFPLFGAENPVSEQVLELPTSTKRPPLNVSYFPERIDTYLTNPGIGWQDGPESFGMVGFPETIAYSNRRSIAWSELNPAENVYDWSALNIQLEAAVQQGKQFSFRVYTHAGEEFGGPKVPAWVLSKGADILSSGEPDYSNCVYQEYWGEFVTELIRVYDGNPDIAFIDISGYGNFNEWSWQDSQTEWDETWASDYETGKASQVSFMTLDGQARRRLADIFVGGSFTGHSCRKAGGATSKVDYRYPGFQQTQLLMPYAGIVQSTEYVFTRRKDVGFRHDCLGREGQELFSKVEKEILGLWPQAPIVYELCKPDETDLENIKWLLQNSHASVVHNNNWRFSIDELEETMLNVGYRYLLNSVNLTFEERKLDIQMSWQNIGTAPSYPKMGQEFQLYFHLLDASGSSVFQSQIPAGISNWQPAPQPGQVPPNNWVTASLELPSTLPAGDYQVGLLMQDTRTGQPIQLSIAGRNKNGIYSISPLTLE